MTAVTTIAVCVTGDSWDVVALCDDSKTDNGPEDIWCQTKAEALREARRAFNETPTATSLIVESKKEFCFKEIRTR